MKNKFMKTSFYSLVLFPIREHRLFLHFCICFNLSFDVLQFSTSSSISKIVYLFNSLVSEIETKPLSCLQLHSQAHSRDLIQKQNNQDLHWHLQEMPTSQALPRCQSFTLIFCLDVLWSMKCWHLCYQCIAIFSLISSVNICFVYLGAHFGGVCTYT